MRIGRVDEIVQMAEMGRASFVALVVCRVSLLLRVWKVWLVVLSMRLFLLLVVWLVDSSVVVVRAF